MDKEKIEQDISFYATEYASQMLNLPEYIQEFKTVHMRLKQEQDIGYVSPEEVRVMQLAEIRNCIFSCIHTTDTHEFYQQNLEMLTQHDPKYIRLMCGDTQLELEGVSRECVTGYKKAMEQGGENARKSALTQAIGVRVILNGLGDLRQKMADNFGNDDFVNYLNDKKFLPT